jgi:hypothetical protein
VALLLFPIAAFIGLTAISRPTTECRMPETPSGPLDLEKAADRRRLADELETVDAVAARYREVIRATPRESDSIDAKRTYATLPDRAYQYCETILREELANAHRIDVSTLAP